MRTRDCQARDSLKAGEADDRNPILQPLPFKKEEGVKMAGIIFVFLIGCGLYDDIGRLLSRLATKHPFWFIFIVFGPIWSALVLEALRSSCLKVFNEGKERLVNICSEYKDTVIKNRDTLVVIYLAIVGPLSASIMPILKGLSIIQHFITLVSLCGIVPPNEPCGDQDGDESSGWGQTQGTVVLMLGIMFIGYRSLWREVGYRAGWVPPPSPAEEQGEKVKGGKTD